MIRLNTISSSQILASLKLQAQEVDESKPNSQASLGSYLNMTLLSVQPFTKRITPPTNPVAIEGLKYQYESFDEEEIPAQVNCNAEKTSPTGETFDVLQPQLRKPRSVLRKSRKHAHAHNNESQGEHVPDNSKSSSEDKQPRKTDKKKVLSNKRRTTTTEAPDVSLEWSTHEPQLSSEESDEADSTQQVKKVKVIHVIYYRNSFLNYHINQEQTGEEFEEASLDLPPMLPFSPFTLAHQDSKARACLVQQFKETVQEITKSLGPQEAEIENMEKIQLAVQMCRSMTYGDLNTAVNTVIEDRTDKSGLQMKQ
jgi:Lipoprotein amino terminal region